MYFWIGPCNDKNYCTPALIDDMLMRTEVIVHQCLIYTGKTPKTISVQANKRNTQFTFCLVHTHGDNKTKTTDNNYPERNKQKKARHELFNVVDKVHTSYLSDLIDTDLDYLYMTSQYSVGALVITLVVAPIPDSVAVTL